MIKNLTLPNAQVLQTAYYFASIVATIATSIAAIAAWKSANAAKVAAEEMRRTNMDAFLPVLKIEDRGSSQHHIAVNLTNIGRGPMYELSLVNPIEKACESTMLQPGEFGVISFERKSLGDNAYEAIFEFKDIFGRTIPTQVNWETLIGPVKIKLVRPIAKIPFLPTGR